jgi:DNA polymerase III sliding clamp (beta) subunit (PCNA family)
MTAMVELEKSAVSDDAREAGVGWVATVGVAGLQKAVARVLPAVPQKAVTPALLGVLIAPSGGALRLSATDLTTHIASECQAEIAGDGGAVLLPARQLADLLARIPPGGSVELSSEGGLIWGAAAYTLPTMDADAFPPAPGVGDSEPCGVMASVLRRMLTACAPIALAGDANRAVLGSIALTVVDGRVVQAQATDGTRVARVWADRPKDMLRPRTLPANCLVPASSAKALLAVLEETPDDDLVPLSRDGAWLSVSTSGVRMQVRLIDGRYPDVGKVLDEYGLGESFAVDRRALKSSLDRLAVVAQAGREQLQVVVLDVDSFGVTLRLDGREDSGRGCERVEADASALTHLEGSEGLLRSVGFDARVLPDVLRWLSGDTCHVALGGRLQPGGWWGDEAVRFDVMPIRM